MSHGAPMNKSWLPYAWVMSFLTHKCVMSCLLDSKSETVPHSISEVHVYITCEWVTASVCMGHVMSHAWMRHVVLLSHPSIMDMGWLRLVGSLRRSWVLLERTRILSGIQFTTHFIEFFVVETKRFDGSLVNVILTRQTCGQRSSRAAQSKRRALGNHFCEWICHTFLISKCTVD